MQAEIADKKEAQVGRWPGTVVARLTARGAARSGVIWGSIFAIAIASSAISYSGIYKTLAQRDALAVAYGSNHATSALLGPAWQLQTVAGFTVFKVSMALMILGAVWGLLTSTRLLRGEEENGRWDLLLAGQTTRRRATAQALGGLAAGVFTLWAVASLVTVLSGLDSKVKIAAGPALYFSTAMVATAVMFLAVGAFCGQLSTSRRQAAGLGSVILGASYALRMVADSSAGLAWLRWATPLGWVEELQPLTRPRPFALVPIVALVIVFALGTLYLAGRRDLGAGTLSDRSNVLTIRQLPTTPLGLAAYLSRSVLLAWAASIFAYGLLLGGIAKSGGKIITSSPSLRSAFARLGVSGADAYLSVALLIMAVALSFVALGQVNAARREESSGQLENLLVRPFSRAVWLVERIALAVAALVLGGLLAGVATWLGAISDHASVKFSSLLSAGLNVSFPALLLFGVGVLVLAVAPRMVSIITYTLFVWFFLVEILGSVVNMNHWILDLSAFHQMAASPAAPIAWTANAVMVAIALVSVGFGVELFRHRDLRGE